MSGSSLNSPPPGTIVTFDNFSAMENTLVQRKAAKGLVEPGSPQLLLPIVVIFAEQQYRDNIEKHRHVPSINENEDYGRQA